MSCYVRHLDDVMEMLGWEITKDNKKRLDKDIRRALDMPDEPCNQVWAKVKEVTNDRANLTNLVALLVAEGGKDGNI